MRIAAALGEGTQTHTTIRSIALFLTLYTCIFDVLLMTNQRDISFRPLHNFWLLYVDNDFILSTSLSLFQYIFELWFCAQADKDSEDVNQ